MSSDHEQIQNLFARYCFAVDRGSADEIAAFFWDDCRLDFSGNLHHGVDEARAGFSKWIAKMRDPVEGLRHCLYTPLIEIDGHVASAEAYYDADGHSKGKGKLVQLRGLYKSRLEKRPNSEGQFEWRLIDHEVQIWRSAQDHGGLANRPREKPA